MKITDIPIGSKVILDIEDKGIMTSLRSKVYDRSDMGILIFKPFDLIGESPDYAKCDSIHLRLLRYGEVNKWSIEESEAFKDEEEGHDLVRLTSNLASKVENKRGAFRVSTELTLVATDYRMGREYPITSIDISQTGFSFRCDVKLDIGCNLGVAFNDGDTSFDIRVKIARIVNDTDGVKYGCVIIQSNHELRKYITNKQLSEIRKSKGII